MGGGHTCSHKTEPRVPISINSSGLASLDASGGLAGVIPVLAVSWQSAEQRQEQIVTKRKGGGVRISSWLHKRMWWEYLDTCNRGDAGLYTPAGAPTLRHREALLRRQLLSLFTILSAASRTPPPFIFLLRIMDLSTLSDSFPVYTCWSVHPCCS